mgnify:FL=1
MASRILLVEDDAGFGDSLERSLRMDGYEVIRRATLAGARTETMTEIDAAILDLELPDGSGIELLKEWRSAHAELPVIFLTGTPTLESAVEALRGRAFDFLRKPISRDALGAVLQRAIESSRLRREVVRLRDALGAETHPHGIVGCSQATRTLQSRISAVAAAPTTVLIQGETGTGKELVAQALHLTSGRKGPFVAINCAALPEMLLEAELFGHRRGAFTGATSDRRGLVAEADGGTLFLDEVGELPLPLQAKLLRLVQNREYRPLGENRARQSDIRIIAATNRDLRNELGSHGKFRDDLYWRLAVVTFEILPLRDRREDIGDLTLHFIARHSARLGKTVRGLSRDALAALEAHDWPGNVRELENVIERAVLLGAGEQLGADDLSIQQSRAAKARLDSDTPEIAFDASTLDDGVDAFERNTIIRLLQEHNGSVARAARAAGRNRTAFYAMMKRLGISKEAVSAD